LIDPGFTGFSTDVDLFDSIILKGMQVQALWFIMSVILVKAMSDVGGGAMMPSQGPISKFHLVS